MKYGIYDTQDHCWVGDSNGPKLFDTEQYKDAYTLARISAQMVETQVFGTDMAARYRARAFHESNLRLKDKKPVKMSAEKALRKLEAGA